MHDKLLITFKDTYGKRHCTKIQRRTYGEMASGKYQCETDILELPFANRNSTLLFYQWLQNLSSNLF